MPTKTQPTIIATPPKGAIAPNFFKITRFEKYDIATA